MTCRTVSHALRDWRFCPEALPPEGDRNRAIVRGRFIDELSGLPFPSDLHIGTHTSGLRPALSHGGIGGLAGNPARRFPGLAANTVSIDMRVDARRYIPRDFAIDLGPIVNFPNAFQAVNLGDVAMHRAASLCRGHVMRENGITRIPMAGATVRLIGMWPVFPDADDDQPATMQNPAICSLSPGLYADRIAGVDTIAARALNPVAGQEKTVLRPVIVGATDIRLSDRLNLAPGDILAIEPNHQDRAEFIPVFSVDGASTADQPATVRIVYGCRQEHPSGVQAVRVIPLAAGAANNVTRHGIPGDRTAFLDALSGLGAAATVEIAGSGSVEYQRVALYEATADPDGAWHFPLLSRVAQIRLRADHPAPPNPLLVNVSPDYDLAEYRVDLVFQGP